MSLHSQAAEWRLGRRVRRRAAVPTMLPTGRNLTSIDPRAIPTFALRPLSARRAAAEVVRRYLQDHGEHPRALVIDLWASASLRTGGDDLAQAFAYLGVQPVWDKHSNRVVGIEIMPLATLDRPRIDVTLRISGLFRDIFESQIALFDLAVRRVAALDEDAADSPLAEARRQGADLARVFGGAPGSYGARAGDLALDGAWQTRADLGEAYLAAVTHAYGGVESPAAAGEAFRSRVVGADVLVHPQDDRERDLLDGDGVADFAGGFAAAAALMGNEPELYHLDTSQPVAPKARRLAEEIARVVRGRLTNPVWLAGMLKHGHRGVAEIAQGVDALYAFSATAAAVPGSLFDATHAALIADEAVLSAMVRSNPAATLAIAQRLRRRPCARPMGEPAQFGRSRTGTRDPSGRPMIVAAAFEIKGWCPGALRPMPSGDGLLVRIRPWCGAFTLEQAAGLSDIAARLGNGHIDPDAAREPAAPRPARRRHARASRLAGSPEPA